MGRKKKRQLADWEESFPLLRDETWHGIAALACFALTLFFFLAAAGYAGAAGRLAFETLSALFGLGYYALPLVLIILGLSFSRLIKPNFVTVRLVAGLVVFLALLGLVGIIGSETGLGGGGWLGQLIAAPLLAWLNIFGVVFLIALLLVAFLILFDTHLKPIWFTPWRWRQTAADETAPTFSPPPAPTEASGVGAGESAAKSAAGGGLTEKSRADQFDLTPEYSAGGAFTAPPLELLEQDSGKPGAGDIKANANIIKRTLQNFGISVEMAEVSIGPSITRYALKPAEGVKLSRILALNNDLALALAAHPIRIEAPIPGKSLVGVEIPNRTKSIVGLASLIGSAEFASSSQPLLVSLGRGISGLPHFANLARAPHILIAGATGSGKSVVIHTFITSLLYRNPPDRLRLLMIDPKRVELTVYNRTPHLLTPVITDAKKAILALKWAIKEMERRYILLEQTAVRDIQSYHKNAKKGGEPMPYIVIIIDELADIMSTYPRELEAAVVRLAQMSRAVGIHLVLSTQRPSVEVITGLIKANIPSRLALQVASQIDSRTILDLAGAEKLLGSGDMLYLSGEMSKPIRLQSAFISEEEVKKVVKFLAKSAAVGDALPPEEIVLTTQSGGSDEAGGLTDDSGGDDDELYEEAREAVVRAGKASASYLQRKLKVGYARAARLLDMLEERQVIGPGEGAKQREVYVKPPEATDA